MDLNAEVALLLLWCIYKSISSRFLFWGDAFESWGHFFIKRSFIHLRTQEDSLIPLLFPVCREAIRILYGIRRGPVSCSAASLRGGYWIFIETLWSLWVDKVLTLLPTHGILPCRNLCLDLCSMSWCALAGLVGVSGRNNCLLCLSYTLWGTFWLNTCLFDITVAWKDGSAYIGQCFFPKCCVKQSC